MKLVRTALMVSLWLTFGLGANLAHDQKAAPRAVPASAVQIKTTKADHTLIIAKLVKKKSKKKFSHAQHVKRTKHVRHKHHKHVAQVVRHHAHHQHTRKGVKVKYVKFAGGNSVALRQMYKASKLDIPDTITLSETDTAHEQAVVIQGPKGQLSLLAHASIPSSKVVGIKWDKTDPSILWIYRKTAGEVAMNIWVPEAHLRKQVTIVALDSENVSLTLPPPSTGSEPGAKKETIIPTPTGAKPDTIAGAPITGSTSGSAKTKPVTAVSSSYTTRIAKMTSDILSDFWSRLALGVAFMALLAWLLVKVIRKYQASQDEPFPSISNLTNP